METKCWMQKQYLKNYLNKAEMYMFTISVGIYLNKSHFGEERSGYVYILKKE